MEIVCALVLNFLIGQAPVVAQPLYFTGKSDPVISEPLSAMVTDSPLRPIRIWILFTDKAVFTQADLNRRIANRRAELPQRTLHRRALRGSGAAMLAYQDLPVCVEYVAAVRNTGALLRHQSRWANAMSVDATARQIQEIAALPFVRRVQPVARAAPRDPIIEMVTDQVSPRDHDAEWYAASFDQLNQIGIVQSHNAGFTGAGVIVGILDTGFNRTHSAFNQTTNGAHPVQIVAEHDFVSSDGDTSQQPGDAADQSSHGTYILGTLGAYHPTILVGGAFDASFILAKTEDISQEVPAEEDNYVAGLEWIESLGADMATSSLGYIDWYTQNDLDGNTAITTIAVNAAIAHGLICCTAAGNSGHDADPATSSLIAPSDAPLVLTCGAVNSEGTIASFSSDGPTADGRVKPEILARGVATQTVSFSTNTNIVGVNGTSLSTPLVAGGVALILQAHPDWSADKVRRALFQTADDFLANSNFDPQYIRGYGIMDVMAAMQFIHGDIDGDGLANGRDIEPFVSALLGTNPNSDQQRRSDCDASGEINAADTAIFVADLLGN
ncbi:MAG: S8 family serine peptidase [Planctomycetes bacterium]|nr:S8 family serine peptidase [Planctomycetota bacterium]